MADGSNAGGDTALLIAEALFDERRRLRRRLARIEIALAERGLSACAVETDDPAPKSSSRTDIDKALQATLSHAAAPLRRRDVLDAIRQCGVNIHCLNPLGSLSSHLIRCAFVVNLKGHGYWHRDRAYPKAGYHPQ
jgi:hypothetical protein